jgi:hypothetical protein
VPIPLSKNFARKSKSNFTTDYADDTDVVSAALPRRFNSSTNYAKDGEPIKTGKAFLTCSDDALRRNAAKPTFRLLSDRISGGT